MRKVKNKAVIRNLSDKSFGANKTRNIIAALAIALTTMLFTIVFTIGLGTVESFQRQTMRQSGGDSHGTLKNLTREQYEKLKDHPLIKECAPCMAVADEVRNPEFLKRHMEMWYYPEYHYKHCFIEIIDGKVPEKADEILMDEVSLELLGLPVKAGQQVTLEMLVKNRDEQVTERTFTVSGVIKADSALDVGFAIVSDAYLTEYAGELTYTYQEDCSLTGAIRMDVSFANSFRIQQKLDKVITDSGYSAEEGDVNYIESNANWAYISDGTSDDPGTLAAMAGALALILLTGYLIIFNIFQISVMKDIRYYGLLKTVGTTGRQIKRILRRQALRLACMGIPAGLLVGFFVGKWVVPMILRLSSFGDDAAVSMNPVIFVGAAVFSLVTVFISVRKPAKIAGTVSPVEAVRYTEGDNSNHGKGLLKGKREKQKKTADGGKIYRMAFSNLARNKRKTAVVIASLSLAVILLNSIFTITSSFDMNAYLKKFVTSDFLIGNASYFGMNHYWGMSIEDVEEESLTESFIQACEMQDGFLEGGRIYGTGTVGLEAASWNAPEYIRKDENGDYYSQNGYVMQKDENGAYTLETMVYGVDEFVMDEMEVWEGEEDLNVIKEKLASGNYIVAAVPVDDNDKVEADGVVHHPGDKVTLIMEDGSRREFEVISLIKTNYYGMTNRSGKDFIYYTTSAVFQEMASEKFLMTYAFNVEDEKEGEFQDFLKEYTTKAEPLMDFESKLKWLDDFSGMKDLVVIVGGVLTLVIGLIGVLNFINSILTGIVTRQKEFAMMEAIGMTKRQLTKMLVLEGLLYAGITIGVSLVFGCLFSFTVVRALSEGIWFMKYHFVILPMMAVFPVLLLMGAAIPYLAYMPQRKESLVERIRQNE